MWDPVAIGRRGGLSKSARKSEAARRNGKLGGAKGGRPPKLPAEPEGLRESWKYPRNSEEHAIKKFAEYYAELIAKKNAAPEQLGWSEKELRDTLARMGRRDLVRRRKKTRAKLTAAQKKNLKRLHNRTIKPLKAKA